MWIISAFLLSLALLQPGHSAPPDFSLSTTATTITLTWTASEDSFGGIQFKIASKREGISDGSVLNNPGSFDFTGLDPGTSFTVAVVEGTTTIFQEDAVTNPSPVRLGEPTSVSTTGLTLSWSKGIGETSSYRLVYTDLDVPNAVAEDVDTTGTSVTLNDLKPGHIYQFSVTALTDGKVSEPASLTRATKPASPAFASEEEKTTTSVKVTWTPGTDSLQDAFEVTYTDDDVGGDSSAVALTEPYFIPTTLVAGHRYSFSMVAVRNGTKSEANTRTVEMVPPRPSLSVDSQLETSLTIKWAYPEDSIPNPQNFWSYVVKYQDLSAETSLEETWQDGLQAESVALTGLSAGRKYKVSVATKSHGNVGNAAEIEANTQPKPPKEVTVSGQSTSQVSVAWQPETESVQDSYQVQYRKGSDEYQDASCASPAGLQCDISVSGAQPGQIINVRVYALSGGVKSDAAESSGNTKPSPPGTMTLTSRTEDTIMVSIVKGDGITTGFEYTVEPSLEASKINYYQLDNTYRIDLTGLNPGTAYLIKVWTTSGKEKSEEVQQSYISKPPKPSPPSPESATTNSLSVTWTQPNLGNFNKYIISINDAHNTMAEKDKDEEKQHSFTNLIPGHNYSITLMTRVTDSQQSVIESDGASRSLWTKPRQARDIKLGDSSTSSLTVEWSVPTEGEYDKFVVSLEGMPDNIQTVNKGSTPRSTFYSLEAGFSYTVVIITEAGDQRSSDAKATFHTKPNPPTNGIKISATTDSVLIQWQGPSQGKFNGFKVKQERAGETAVEVSLSKNVTTHRASDLKPGVEYTYRIVTTVPEAASAEEVVYVLTKPVNVRDLKVVRKQTREVDLEWTAPLQDAGVSGYDIKLVEVATGISKEHDEQFSGTSKSFVLTPGGVYRFEVMPYVTGTNNAKAIGAAETLTFTMVPEKPRNLQKRNVGTSYIEISWDAPDGAFDGYLVSYHKTSDNNMMTKDLEKESSSYQIPSLEAGVTYAIQLKTKSGLERSIASTIQIATDPSSVAEIVKGAVTTTSIEISWSEPQNTVFSSYELSIRPGGTGTITIQRGESLRHVFTGLNPGVEHRVSIKVISSGSTSQEKSRSIYTKPSPVSNLRAQSEGTKTLKVTWDADTRSSQSTFKLLYSAGEGATKARSIQSTGGDRYQVYIDRLTPGVTYSIEVYAETFGALAETSDHVNTTATTRPSQVQDMVATVLTESVVRVTWKADEESVLENFEVSWRLRASGSGGQWSKPLVTEDTRQSLTGLIPGRMIEVRVLAQSGGQLSEPVTNDSVVLFPFPPERLQVQTRDESSLTITWDYDPGRSYLTRWKLEYTQTGTTDWRVDDDRISPETTTSRVSSLRAGQKYTVRVSAITLSNVQSLKSSTIDATVIPVITTELREKEDETNTNTITITYTEERNNPGVFDNYLFWNNRMSKGDAKTKNAGDPRRIVRFDNLNPGEEYTVYAATRSGGVDSLARKQIGITTNPKPPKVNCDVVEDERIKLTLEKPEGTVQRYQVACQGERCPSDPRRIDVTTQRLFETFNNLLPYKEYTFLVYAESNGKQSTTASVMCTTGQSEPGPVIIGEPENLRPYQVTITWSEPQVKNGIIKAYFLRVAQGETIVMNKTDALGGEARKYTFTELKAGLTYTFSVWAYTIADGERTSITVTMPVEPPFIAEESKPTIDKEKDLAHDTMKVKLVNPFSDLNGPIESYSVIVGRQSAAPPPDADIHKYASAMSQSTPVFYAAIYRCADLFKDADGDRCWRRLADGRRKRDATPGATTYVTIGGDESCTRSVEEFCNGPLEPDTTYYVTLRAYTRDALGNLLSSDAPTSQPIRTEVSPSLSSEKLAIIFTVIAVVVLAGALLAFLVVLRRKGYICAGRESADSYGSGHDPTLVLGSLRVSDRKKKQGITSRPVKICDFAEHCRLMSCDSDLRYSEEYEDLKNVGREQPCSAADLPVNRNKNRFTNILPYDHSRVKLLPTDDEEGSDYINANWMPGYNSKREFIVTQGPLPSTRDDFWRMVWEQNARAIVMLTKCVEKGREKCDHYWPVDSEPMYYGDLRVLVLNETKCTEWVVSEFEIAKGDQMRRLVHFHYTGWPDFGVPEKPQSLIRFVRLVRTRLSPEGGPIVVHCSAGVGRSGTMISLDRTFQILEAAPDNQAKLDVFGIVNEMRRYRVWMVQTEQQYVCIHDCLNCVIEGRENEDYPYAGHDNDGFEPDDEGIADN